MRTTSAERARGGARAGARARTRRRASARVGRLSFLYVFHEAHIYICVHNIYMYIYYNIVRDRGQSSAIRGGGGGG